MMNLIGLIMVVNVFLTSCFNDNNTINIGLIYNDCIASEKDNLSGEEVNVFYKKEVGIGHLIRKVVAQNSESSCEMFQLERDMNFSEETNFYTVENNQDIGWGIGVISSEKLSFLDLDNDNIEDSINICTTSEGIQLKVLNKETEAVLWEHYYYLGYDLESDCN
ncbi:hypothetical protein [Flammeovirga aprica]|uniref:Uncharacterized protein n=1 Tax=Flammeovirga aprica JL-4 TaxID=694437 RepID=A0A7X9RZI7_9BACT|nr:hypothetical protein [Flammeovirga aprica]NME71555.1 hypothetical protein [Flammeovirga aprica JL-4]